MSTWPLSSESLHSCAQCVIHVLCSAFALKPKCSIWAPQAWSATAWPRQPSTSCVRVWQMRTVGCHRELLLWPYYRKYRRGDGVCTVSRDALMAPWCVEDGTSVKSLYLNMFIAWKWLRFTACSPVEEEVCSISFTPSASFSCFLWILMWVLLLKVQFN